MNARAGGSRRPYGEVLRLSFLLNKSVDVSASRPLLSFLRFDLAKHYLVFSVARLAVQVVLGLVALILCGQYLGRDVVVLLSVTGFALVAASPLFVDLDLQLKKYRAHYLLRTQVDEASAGVVLLDCVFAHGVLKGAGSALVGAGTAVVLGGWRAAVALVACLAIAYLLFIGRAYFTVQINSLSGMAAYVLTGVLVFGSSMVVFHGVMSLLIGARHGLSAAESVKILDLTFSSVVSRATESYLSAHYLPVAAVCITLMILAAAVLRRSRLGVLADDGFASHYVAARLPAGRPGFRGPIAAILHRTSPRFGHTELSVIVPMEFWIVMGMSVSVTQHVRNPWAILTVGLVQVYIVATAVFREFASHYNGVFELADAPLLLRQFRQASRDTRRDFHGAVETVLTRLAAPPAIALCLVLLVVMSVLAWRSLGGWFSALLVGAGLVLAAALVRPLARLCMAPPIDAFEILVRNNKAVSSAVTPEDLVTLSGYRAIKSLRGMPVFLVQAAIVATVMLLPALGVVRGVAWLFVMIGAVLGLLVSTIHAGRSAIGVSS